MKQQVMVLEQIMGANQRLAAENRERLDQAGVYAINLMASPGAGKTSLIERTLPALDRSLRVAVVEGDISSSLDADRALAAGGTAIQINTGGECHLDAVMLRQALDQLPLEDFGLLIVENVGNLICPIGFDLGTHCNVLVASTPEGDDKPYKYPGSYRGVDALVINKIDLLEYVPFDMQRFQRGVETLSPGLATFALSCQTGDGIDAWVEWLESQVREFQTSS